MKKILYIIGILTIQIPVLFAPLGAFDEGVQLTAAQRILHGQKFYTDFWFEYPPGLTILIALLSKITQNELLSIRILELLVRTLLVWVVLIYNDNFNNQKRGSLFSASLCLLALTNLDMYGHNGIYGITISILILHIRNLEKSSLLLQGLLFGFLLLLRHDFAVYLLSSIVIHSLLINNSIKGIFSYKALIGACISTSFAFLFLSPSRLLLQKLYEDLIVFPIEIYPKVRHISYPKISDILKLNFLTQDTLFYLIPIIFFTATIYAYRCFLKNKNISSNLILICILGLHLLNYVRIRADIYHLYPTIFISILITTVLTSKILNSIQVNLIHTIFFIIGLINIVIVFKTTWLPILPKVQMIGFVPYKSILLLGQESRSITANYVSKITDSNEKIFLVSQNNDATFINDVAFYVLANRLPGSQYQELHPGVTTTPEVQMEIIEELRSNKAKVVIRQANILGYLINYESNLLDNYVKKNFKRIFMSGDYEVLIRI